jgi:hypothetical protein
VIGCSFVPIKLIATGSIRTIVRLSKIDPGCRSHFYS